MLRKRWDMPRKLSTIRRKRNKQPNAIDSWSVGPCWKAVPRSVLKFESVACPNNPLYVYVFLRYERANASLIVLRMWFRPASIFSRIASRAPTASFVMIRFRISRC
jgi:hypothetical protein